MNIDKIFESIINVDKEILNIYQQIIRNEYLGKDNHDNVKKLKLLIELEEWTYKRLNLDYKEIHKILIAFEKKSISEDEFDQNLLFSRMIKNNILENDFTEQEIKQLVYFRIYTHLKTTYYLDINIPKIVNKYNNGNQILEKQDDKSDIYLIDSSYLPFRLMSESQYIQEALTNHKVVLTFNTQARKQLEIEAMVDIEQLSIMLFEIKVNQNIENRYYYLEKMYLDIFRSKSLEERVVSANFSFDELYEQFSHKKQSNKNNKNFINVVRQQISYNSIFELLIFLLSFNDNEFTNGVNKRYNLVNFNIYLEYLRSYICFLRYDELDLIREYCYHEYRNIIEQNKCSQMVYESLSDEFYYLLQSFIEVEEEKVQKLV